ncbi:MAG: aminopeptidase [Candidatus Woesearchaeota archaeon]
MNYLKFGLENAINNCIKLKKNETITIISDKKTIKIGQELFKITNKITPNAFLFIVENFSKRPLKFIPKIINEKINNSNVAIIAMQGQLNELKNFRRPILKKVENNKNLRIANMINVTKDTIKQGMNYDYKNLQKFTKKIYNLLIKTKKINVTTKKGTNLIIEFNSKYNWIISDGNIKKGEWKNLPDGEVFTCPYKINGKIVIDGTLGDYFAKKYTNLNKEPLIIEIKNSKAIKINSKNKNLEKEFKKILKTDKNSSRVGEFALGTNLGIKKLINVMLLDEKYPGIHIAFGNSYPKKTNSNFNSKIHIDCVIKKPTIILDNKKIMNNGVYLI